MKMLKKLALVSAVSMISAGAFAMEAMDDESMASATGQDGITVLISPGTMVTSSLAALGVSTTTSTAIDLAGVDAAGTGVGLGRVKGLTIGQVNIHDADGFSGSATAGAIVIGGGNNAGVSEAVGSANYDLDRTVVFADDTNPIKIEVDSSGNAGKPVLNVKISTPTLAIKTGNIYVATSSTGAAGGVISDKTKILNGMEIILGASVINIQLGNEVQTVSGAAVSGTNPTAMMAINAKLTNGLTINNTKLDDANGAASTGTAANVGGGSIYIGSLKITNASTASAVDALNGGTGTISTSDLYVRAGINVEDKVSDISPHMTPGWDDEARDHGGLVITLAAFGSNDGANIVMTGTRLGTTNLDGAGLVIAATSTKALGDVEILGLKLAGTSIIIHGH